MRDQGRLVEWFDEKGYGFIQPNDDSKDRVFLHIKDFARQGPRPKITADYETLRLRCYTLIVGAGILSNLCKFFLQVLYVGLYHFDFTGSSGVCSTL